MINIIIVNKKIILYNNFTILPRYLFVSFADLLFFNSKVHVNLYYNQFGK